MFGTADGFAIFFYVHVLILIIIIKINRIRDILGDLSLGTHKVKIEVGNNLSRDHIKTYPADILLP